MSEPQTTDHASAGRRLFETCDTPRCAAPSRPEWGVAWTRTATVAGQRLRCCVCHRCLYFHHDDRAEAVSMMLDHVEGCR